MRKSLLIIFIQFVWCGIIIAQPGIEGQDFAFGIGSSVGYGIGKYDDGFIWLSSFKLKCSEKNNIIIKGGLNAIESTRFGEIAILYRRSFCKGTTQKSSKFIFNDKNQKFLKILYYNRFRPYVEGGIGTSFSGGIGIEYYLLKQFSFEFGVYAFLPIAFSDELFFIPKFELTFWPF